MGNENNVENQCARLSEHEKFEFPKGKREKISVEKNRKKNEKFSIFVLLMMTTCSDKIFFLFSFSLGCRILANIER